MIPVCHSAYGLAVTMVTVKAGPAVYGAHRLNGGNIYL